MKACRLVIGGSYLYSEGGEYVEVVHTGFGRNGYLFRRVDTGYCFSLSGLQVREFIYPFGLVF